MRASHNIEARKRLVNLTLNEDLVQRAKGMADNLSSVIESLLSEFVARKQRQQLDKAKLVKATMATWNNFNAKSGSFSDEYSSL